jgi:peptidoglycan/xylan/chitin deacetylase (PgdA/CDA1 family)
MHIDELRRHFTLVHLDDWIRRRAAGSELPRLACALTFDDGWLDNHQFAFPVLRQSAAPATIYLVADLVGTLYAFWPNRLTQLLRTPMSAGVLKALPERFARILHESSYESRPMTRAQIDSVIGRCKQIFTDSEIELILDGVCSGEPHTGASGRNLMDWDEIREMHATGLVRFGSHSRRHTRLLESVSEERVQDEVIGSGQVIEQRIGVRPATFCYPNGDHSAAALAFVRPGYVAATTTIRGWNSLHCDPHLLKRVGLHEDVSATRAAFLSRIAGIG